MLARRRRSPARTPPNYALERTDGRGHRVYCQIVGHRPLNAALDLLMKMSRDQRFYWTEPFAFVKARARTAADGGKFLLVMVLVTLLAIALVATDSPTSPRDFALVALFSIVPALLIAYPGMWLFSRIPNSVLIAKDRIAVGREVTPFETIQSAVVGTTRIEGVEHRVFTFRTKDGRENLYGLSHKINSEQLAQFLQQAGVHEPQV